ncbi:MAG TPA: hypothetical protein VJ696_08615, partial [Rhodanobacteraceae bacterium]|nr:hypothetical protein [Rhodanobacteraceae bacterium]
IEHAQEQADIADTIHFQYFVDTYYRYWQFSIKMQAPNLPVRFRIDGSTWPPLPVPGSRSAFTP